MFTLDKFKKIVNHFVSFCVILGQFCKQSIFGLCVLLWQFSSKIAPEEGPVQGWNMQIKCEKNLIAFVISGCVCKNFFIESNFFAQNICSLSFSGTCEIHVTAKRLTYRSYCRIFFMPIYLGRSTATRAEFLRCNTWPTEASRSSSPLPSTKPSR
jgi:hypothetical protein